MPQFTVALTGATGFVGSYIVEELLARGHRVRALARTAEEATELSRDYDENLVMVVGELSDPATAAELVSGCDACIHLVGILREADGQTFQKVHVGLTEAILKACRDAGVKRYLHMSALGVCSEGVAEYQRTKWEAEKLVKRSGLDWTIFRPSMIHGVDGEAINMMHRWSMGQENPWFFMPYFTRWEEDKRVPLGSMNPIDPRIAPVAAEDVARAYASALETPESVGEIYNLAGSDVLTWPEMLAYVRDHAHGDPGLQPFGVPGEISSVIGLVAKKLGVGALLPHDDGMPRMASQDSVASLDKVKRHLGVEPRGFRETFLEYAGQLD
jgi:NADH dehydrogenase